MTIDLLKEMPQIAREIGRVDADLHAPSMLCKAFDRIQYGRLLSAAAPVGAAVRPLEAR